MEQISFSKERVDISRTGLGLPNAEIIGLPAQVNNSVPEGRGY